MPQATTGPRDFMTSSDGVFERVFSKARATPLVEDEPTVVIETTQGDESVDPTVPQKTESGRAKVSAVSMAALFRNPDAHPLVLDLVLLRKYGTAWLGWELETLLARVSDDFRTPTVADINVEKLQACKALHLVDDFWSRWEVFLPCCAAFNGSLADFHRMQVPEVAECMVAVDVANRIRDDVRWSDEIRGFLGVVHRHAGVLCPQEPLEFVGVDIEGLPVDCADVRARWPEVRASRKAPTGGSIEDEQLRRLLAAWAYLEMMRDRLTSQLPLLQHV